MRGVLLVGSQSCVIELRVSILSHLQLHVEQLLQRLGSLQLLDNRHDGLQSFLLAADRVHGQFVVVREFLLNGALLIGARFQFLQDAVDTFVVVLAQTVERTEP